MPYGHCIICESITVDHPHRDGEMNTSKTYLWMSVKCKETKQLTMWTDKLCRRSEMVENAPARSSDEGVDTED